MILDTSSLLDLVTDLLNYVLRLDPNLSSNTNALLEQRICVSLTDLNFKITISFIENGIKRVDAAGKDDLTIEGSLLSLISFIITQDLSLAKKLNLKFIGDVDTANQIQKFIHSIEIDWEENLAKYVGDVTAVAICKFASSSKEKFSKIFSDILQMCAEYLVEESKQIPHHIEIADFVNQVDELVARSNRLESRYAKLALTINQ